MARKACGLLAILLMSVCVMLAGAVDATAQQLQKTQRPARAAAKATQDTLKAKKSTRELVLGEINIEAIIEKPNVDILPSRIKPEIEEIAFIDRSFEHEIKKVPKNFHLYDDELDRARRLTKLKQLLEKKKKQLEK